MPSLTHGPLPLRVLKVISAVALGAPATMIWLPFMFPFALFGPFLLARDALAGHVNAGDVRAIAIAMAGTLGLVGFWLWVFDHPGRSVRLQRVVGLLWLAGAVMLGVNLSVPNMAQMWIVTTAVLLVVVLAMGLAMTLRPRRPVR